MRGNRSDSSAPPLCLCAASAFDPIPRRVTDGSVTPCGLTSPAQGAGQLAAQEPAPDDGDGLQLSGNFFQRFKILDLFGRVTVS